jgi:hypothetical protein
MGLTGMRFGSETVSNTGDCLGWEGMLRHKREKMPAMIPPGENPTDNSSIFNRKRAVTPHFYTANGII